MEIVFLLIIFLYGSIFGSFLNVVIDRLPRDEKFFKDRSYCESCKKTLRWYDLIPLFSFLFLRGKCRYCKKPIPPRLFLIELFCGLMFVLLYSLNSTLPFSALVSIFAIFLAVFAIFMIDVKHKIIPDVLLIVILIAALLYHFVLGHDFSEYLLSGFISLLFFLALFLGTKGRGMGFGDVKFSFVIGFLLGFPHTVIAFYSAFLTGAIISVILILSKRKKLRGETIPFGPFLIVGIATALLFTNEIITLFF